jgi:hypothetical protein
MTVFMLHFDCFSKKTDARVPELTADACVVDGTLEQAEAAACEAIEGHGYRVGSLIAYNRLEEAKIAGLSDYEAALYLKAVQRKPKAAVVFS